MSKEFYKLENELVEEFGRLGDVPESNRKLRKMREMVGVT